MKNRVKSLLHLGILISGRGSNMEAILKAIKNKKISVKPSIIISNKPNARGLKIAKNNVEIKAAPGACHRHRN